MKSRRRETARFEIWGRPRQVYVDSSNLNKWQACGLQAAGMPAVMLAGTQPFGNLIVFARRARQAQGGFASLHLPRIASAAEANPRHSLRLLSAQAASSASLLSFSSRQTMLPQTPQLSRRPPPSLPGLGLHAGIMDFPDDAFRAQVKHAKRQTARTTPAGTASSRGLCCVLPRSCRAVSEHGTQHLRHVTRENRRWALGLWDPQLYTAIHMT